MKHMIQPFGIDMHKNVLTDTKAVKHMHFYEADKTNTILNISFIPSSTTEWIICYNDNNDISEFICIGCQNIFTTLSLKEFDHYFGIRFDNTGCYFNKGCDIKTYPVNITDNIFRYEPAPESYEMQLIKDFHNSSSLKTELHFLKHLLQIARPSALFLKILRNLTDLYIQVPVLLQNYQKNQNIL